MPVDGAAGCCPVLHGGGAFHGGMMMMQMMAMGSCRRSPSMMCHHDVRHAAVAVAYYADDCVCVCVCGIQRLTAALLGT